MIIFVTVSWAFPGRVGVAAPLGIFRSLRLWVPIELTAGPVGLVASVQK